MKNKQPRWAFFSYGYNLEDFTRAVETAIGMKETGARVKFYNPLNPQVKNLVKLFSIL